MAWSFLYTKKAAASLGRKARRLRETPVLCFRSRHQEFYPVELVRRADACVVVKREDVRALVAAFELFDYAFAGYMVRQAGDGLHAEYVFHSAFDERDHFRREQPALAALVGLGHYGGAEFCELFYAVRLAVARAAYRLGYRGFRAFKQPDGGLAADSGQEASA